jgi:polysaccharide biosynthesis protein VpsM
MNRSLLRLAAWSAILLPQIAHADPLLSFGPDVPLFITAAASVRHESNIFLSPQDRTSDTIYVLVPGLDLQWTGGKATFGIAANEQFSRYASNKELNDHLADIASNFGYNGASLTATAAASYQQEDQTSLSLQSSDQTVKHAMANASLNTELQVAPKTSVGVGGAFTRTTYPQVGFIDTDVTTVPVDVYYSTSAKTAVSAGYEYSRTVLDTGTGNSKSSFINVGARGQFTDKLSGQVRVGITTNDPEVGAKERDLGLSANLQYSATPKTSVSLNASSGFSTSPIGSTEKVVGIGASAHSQLSDAWAVDIGGTYNSTDYLNATSRQDKFWVGNIALSYIWTTSISFQLDYVTRKNDSTLPFATFDDNVLTFTATSKF